MKIWEKVNNITGNSSKARFLIEYINAGAKFILSALPEKFLWTIASESEVEGFDSNGASQIGTGSSIAYDKVLAVYRYDGSTKFETKSYGVKVGGDLWLDDSNTIKVGSSGDLQIYHDGSHSYIKDAGTGNLKVQSDSSIVTASTKVQFESASEDEVLAVFYENDRCELYHNGTTQLLTTSDGVEIKPDVEGSNAVLYLTADQGDDNLDKWAIKAASDGTIYHQSYTSGSFVTKFETRAGGDIKVNNGNILMGTAGTGIRTANRYWY